ncbi:MAG TPA: SpoIIE family protein phosphatase [Terriglobia bacterium]|nr:SpoIIE family protein phosphatase [Terriglobia bacterium]
MTPRIQWRNPDGEERHFVIGAEEIVIGRSGDATISLPYRHVSRRHARIAKEDEGIVLTDLSSSFGTLVNGERIQRRTLAHGDIITLGRDDAELQFLIDDTGPSSRADAAAAAQRTLEDLNQALPSAVSDLERLMCVLDFQLEWNEVFTPENSLEQILESALKISGAERAFIMVAQGGGFGFGSGRDGQGRKLSEAHFQTSQSVVRKVVATGNPVFMTEGIDSDLASSESIVAMNLRAVSCMPLVGIPNAGDAPVILGILYLDSTRAMHLASGLDQKIMSRLAMEAGNVLERVEMGKSIEQRKKLERDLALAEETQRSLLPRKIPVMEFLRLFAFSRPTRYVGGDFYHFEKLRSGTMIGVLADVSGKGIAASLLSSMLVGSLQLLLRGGSSPKDALTQLNLFLLEKASNRFVTMFLFAVNSHGSGEFISAGHNPAYLYRASGSQIEELMATSLMVGAFDFAVFESSPLELQPGDFLLVYTDGLTEAENSSGDMFGEERLKELILREAPDGAEKLVKKVLAAVEAFIGTQLQSDDITIVILERPVSA